ncbi:GNAT family N-acyltransferase [Phytomonospora sp. NPDC050363]|uniref:GNAT family N-acetyltransferase n=1 Tax=Phytomonospora sp. NPDC050363 TaxID=3155642 RepID=UPI0033F75398
MLPDNATVAPAPARAEASGRSTRLATDNTRYSIRVADAAEVRAAQRLRHRVFAGELGATLHSPTEGLDIDAFDAHCDHLVVVHDPTEEVVGTYRMLPPGRTPRLYSDGEFDLSALDGLRGGLVETGRSCVDPAHRDGAVINLMWAGIARYLLLTGHRLLAGCASVPAADADEVWAHIAERHLSAPGLRVTPLNPWPLSPARANLKAVPPLLRGYLRLGAKVCGPPAYDPDFGVADFYIVLDLDDAHPRYLKHFLGEQGLGERGPRALTPERAA